MRVLVVYCHPVETSVAAALHDEAVAALRAAGHDVQDLDLYAEGFDPVLNRQGRIDYHDESRNRRSIERYVEQSRWAEGLVVVYPTWWYGLPAMLKGYFDRVWVPGVAFGFDAQGHITTGQLSNIRKIAGVTTSGAPWWVTELYMGNPGKRLIKRGFRKLCAPGCAFEWYQHYDIDRSTPASRAAFLAKVRTGLRAF